MSHRQISEQPESGRSVIAAASPSSPRDQKSDAHPEEHLQHLIDQVAGFNLYVIPDVSQSIEPGGSRTVVGIRVSETLHRFDIRLQTPSRETGVRATNIVGESAGRVDLCWKIIPHDYVARPDREPPATPLDSSQSQRFVMQEMTFRFGDGRDGFRSFGTGRTFPVMAGSRAKLVAAAIGNLTEGFGKFRGHEGNFTLCGELNPDKGFLGHVVVRVLDESGNLRTREQLPSIKPATDPDPATTFLMWTGQKGTGPDQENKFSLAPDGQVRGLNIPTQLEHLHLDFASQRGQSFLSTDLRTGEVVGREIGFGRGSDPAAPPVGTALSPFRFEGVAHYSFYDRDGKTIGAITTNVLEGRRFDVKLIGAPEEPALRFGFFGPIVLGSGCFRGVAGMFYGASGSILQLPPGHHVITHFYIARINDTEGRFRAAMSESGID